MRALPLLLLFWSLGSGASALDDSVAVELEADGEQRTFQPTTWRQSSVLSTALRTLLDVLPEGIGGADVVAGLRALGHAAAAPDHALEQQHAGSARLATPPRRRTAAVLHVDDDDAARRGSASVAVDATGSGSAVPRREAVHARQLQQSASASAPACSGIGIFIPQTGPSLPIINTTTTSFACNGSPVNQASYAALTTAQGEAATTGITPVTTGVLAVALANEGDNVTRTLIRGTDPLPPSINVSTLPLAVRVPILSSANGNVTTKGQLFPPGVAGNVVQIGTLLNAIGPVGTADLIDGTQCVATTVVQPSPTPRPNPSPTASSAPVAAAGVCACPLDRWGPACEYARHFQCAVAIADPLYHACVAANGEGFVMPGNEGGTGSAGLGGSGLGQAANSSTAGEQHVPEMGPGSGVAAAEDTDALLDAGAFFGHAGSRSLPRPVPRPRSDPHAYRPWLHGDPPCLYLNVSHVHRQVKEAAEAGRPALLPLRFRVRCSWLDQSVAPLARPGTTTLSATALLADPRGVLYAGKPAAPVDSLEDVLQEHGRGSWAYGSSAGGGPTVRSGSGADVIACNGTELTPARLAALLQAAGYTADNATAAGPWPYYGLPCLEAAFLPSYAVGPPVAAASAVGGNASSPTAAAWAEHPAALLAASGLPGSTFALAAERAVPLAIRLRALHPTYLSDARGLTLAPLPWSALQGGEDVSAYLDLAPLLRLDGVSRAAGGDKGPGPATATNGLPLDPSVGLSWWPAGRLYLEARVVMAPQGVQGAGCGDASSSSGASGGLYGPAAAQACAPLNDTSTRLAFGASSTLPSPAPAPWLGPFESYPLLLLSNIHRLHLEDSSYVEPTAVSRWRKQMAIGLALGIPIALLALCCLGLYMTCMRRRARLKSEAAAQALKQAQVGTGEADLDWLAATMRAKAAQGGQRPAMAAAGAGGTGRPA